MSRVTLFRIWWLSLPSTIIELNITQRNMFFSVCIVSPTHYTEWELNWHCHSLHWQFNTLIRMARVDLRWGRTHSKSVKSHRSMVVVEYLVGHTLLAEIEHWKQGASAPLCMSNTWHACHCLRLSALDYGLNTLIPTITFDTWPHL